jgi:hypothetical protein
MTDANEINVKVFETKSFPTTGKVRIVSEGFNGCWAALATNGANGTFSHHPFPETLFERIRPAVKDAERVTIVRAIGRGGPQSQAALRARIAAMNPKAAVEFIEYPGRGNSHPWTFTAEIENGNISARIGQDANEGSPSHAAPRTPPDFDKAAEKVAKLFPKPPVGKGPSNIQKHSKDRGDRA